MKLVIAKNPKKKRSHRKHRKHSSAPKVHKRKASHRKHRKHHKKSVMAHIKSAVSKVTRKHKRKAHRKHHRKVGHVGMKVGRRRGRKTVRAILGSAHKTRPVFYTMGKGTIKRSPYSKRRYSKMVNPMKFVKENLKDVVSELPTVLSMGGGYYLTNGVVNWLPDNIKLNNGIRILSKVGVAVVSGVGIGMINKKVARAMFYGSMFNALNDAVQSFGIADMTKGFINIQDTPPVKKVSSGAGTSTGTTEEGGAGMLINEGEINTIIGDDGLPF